MSATGVALEPLDPTLAIVCKRCGLVAGVRRDAATGAPYCAMCEEPA